VKTIQISQTVEADGHIRLDIPAGRAGEQMDVLVVLHPAPEAADQSTWKRFVKEMAGSCPDLEAPDDPPPAPLGNTL